MVVNFGRFLFSQIFRGRCPRKLYTHYYPHLKAHHVVKFHGATFLSSKFMIAHTLHFMTILTPIAKNCWENPVSGGMCASEPWSFYSACKVFGAQLPLIAEIWFFQKVGLVGLIAPLNLHG